MYSKKFEVPIVHSSLQQEVTIVQIADVLDYLNKMVDEIFVCIENKISQNRHRLCDLQQRCEVAKNRVNHLARRKKSTKVVSSDKYPASSVSADYESMFSRMKFLPFRHTEVNNKMKNRYNYLDGTQTQEELQLFGLKKIKEKIIEEADLGGLPCDLDSVCSLILFNTLVNPFKNYVMLDPLGSAIKSRHTFHHFEACMEAAPFTISQTYQIEQLHDVNFNPVQPADDMPQMNMPKNLPDLGGVADDLCYSKEFESAIVPFASARTISIKLPISLPETPASSLSQSENYMHSYTDSLLSLPSPHSEQYGTETRPPPPPPPPQPSLKALPSHSAYVEPVSQFVSVHTSNDARANLMEAIRKAGVSNKLHHIRNLKTESNQKKNGTKEIKGISTLRSGDLITDLHTKLAMRRKCVSGRKSEVSVEEMMDQVCAMIPSPEASSASSTASNDYSEDDWE